MKALLPMRRSAPVLLLAVLLLAGCGDPPPRPEAKGQEARAAMDLAAAHYWSCVKAGAEAMPLTDETQAGPAASAIIKGCADTRRLLVDRVYDVRRIGHDQEAEAISREVADQSVKAIEGELRERAVVVIVQRQVAAQSKPQG